MKFLLSCRELRHPDAALLLMIQLTQLQWWFLHQDLLKHLKQIPTHLLPLLEINYPAGPPPVSPGCHYGLSWISRMIRINHIFSCDQNVFSGSTRDRTSPGKSTSELSVITCGGVVRLTRSIWSRRLGMGGGLASSFAWGGQRQLRVWALGALWGC